MKNLVKKLLHTWQSFEDACADRLLSFGKLLVNWSKKHILLAVLLASIGFLLTFSGTFTYPSRDVESFQDILMIFGTFVFYIWLFVMWGYLFDFSHDFHKTDHEDIRLAIESQRASNIVVLIMLVYNGCMLFFGGATAFLKYVAGDTVGTMAFTFLAVIILATMCVNVVHIVINVRIFFRYGW